jgi:hypothetical protein
VAESSWKNAGATERKGCHVRTAGKRASQAKTVASGGDQSPTTSHGKEGVDGSSPSEGSAKARRQGLRFRIDLQNPERGAGMQPFMEPSGEPFKEPSSRRPPNARNLRFSSRTCGDDDCELLHHSSQGRDVCPEQAQLLTHAPSSAIPQLSVIVSVRSGCGVPSASKVIGPIPVTVPDAPR